MLLECDAVTKRRLILIVVAVIAAGSPPVARSQQLGSTGRLQKVGILSPGKQEDAVCLSNKQGGNVGCFVEALRALGSQDPRVALEYRFAEGVDARLDTLATELVGLKPDVIYTFTTRGAEAAARATRTIPIVVGPAGERVFERLAGSFARPVGNLTGLTLNSREQVEKCLQVLKELSPRTSHVAVMVNPDNPNIGSYLDLLRPPAERMGIALIRIDSRNLSELPQAFANIQRSPANAIFLEDDAALGGTSEVRQEIARWALQHRLPMASTNARAASDGGLVSLGADASALAKRAASYVHRILGGARPADLPVERPTVYRLSLNRGTATALGLTISTAVLLRVDEVIP